jgi:hypothetical protein
MFHYIFSKKTSSYPIPKMFAGFRLTALMGTAGNALTVFLETSNESAYEYGVRKLF